MLQETLARKFRPAGFEQPEGSRREYTKPRMELQEAFDRWVEELSRNYDRKKNYRRAQELINPIGEIPYKEANSLLVDFKLKKHGDHLASIFVSACYNQSQEQLIIFDLERGDIDCIGYKLAKNKVLVNIGETGYWFGNESSGTVLNNHNTKDGLGWLSSGIILNNGKTGKKFGLGSSGLAIVLREPEDYGLQENGVIIRSSDFERNPEMKRYLEELEEITKNIKDEESAQRFFEVYGSEPRERIEQDIKEFLVKGEHKE